MQDAKLLLVDDDPDVLLAARLLLKRHVSTVDIEKNPEKLPFLLNNNRYDAIVLDMNFQRDVSSGREGFAWLDRILDIDPKARVVLFTAYGDVEMAVRAIKAGAVDFVLKPWQNDKFLDTIRGAVEGRKDRSGGAEGASSVLGKESNGKEQSDKKSTKQTNIIGSAMRPVLDTVEQVAPTDANVLILGENGTGKDLIARAIHDQSLRKDKPFVSVDVGALTESLFESELFGHVKGAFTDARDDRAGRFEEANGGTIFLDEIGNLTPSQQARLLTVLQQRQVTRVGSNKARPVDVRLICATNADLNERVAERAFRQDLLYRINTIELHLPPLRERPSDIAPLAEFFLKKYAKQYNRSVSGLSPALLAEMKQYRWPGNVRELQHAVERAIILARPELARPELGQGTMLQPESFVFRNGTSVASPVNETLQLEDMERQLIHQAMQKHRGSITDVARELGLSRQALYRRLEKFGL
ncbi:sigma-54-dependent transcriptional regulator [Spirosoma endophyticum]|uniref:DNA-binding transcriptional response regulator, NtrC family, contains REC, AAA-type ATPase, and a Fis-type DNA-binding domains n=1 Tax=Spirosoma endophyticum TaxID=662367 RepID=A0A1I1VG64_9BACT|nr:sigma-54 dependent transcriptional regulator [Spirosoma endophyticum]SFD81775.1 DNA-binding transcriptional response regulator, NtrC family, contains REC, AAA-type ATPase, and a Fis-type DNA-binding domains [Spirosoma endophyticum]